MKLGIVVGHTSYRPGAFSQYLDSAGLSDIEALVVSTQHVSAPTGITHFYLQQQIGWQDRLFVTGAVRADDNSAFGKDFNAAIYPKLSAAWVVHEESFWNVPLVNAFRLRGAWGKAGRQPATFAAVSLYRPRPGPNNEPTLYPGALGNPDLGPEVGTEVELGFDQKTGYAEAQRCLNCDVQTVFTPRLCIECDACVDICPVRCLIIAPDGEEAELRMKVPAPALNLAQPLFASGALPQTGRLMVKDEDICIHCGLCAERCPTAAWDMRRFELLQPYAGRPAGSTRYPPLPVLT